MNDFEDKLRSFELRRPNPAWRGEILARCSASTSGWTLRACLWPSPVAWAALFMIWAALGITSRIDRPAAMPALPMTARASLSTKITTGSQPSLFAFQSSRQFEELYSFSKPLSE